MTLIFQKDAESAGFTNIDCTFYAIYLQRHYSVVLQLFP